jgi:hypothetical protein
MFKVKGDFFGDFKTGDNINYTLQVLTLLYEFYGVSDRRARTLLCKPIILLETSIVEAILHDFYMRIRRHTTEGIASIKREELEVVRSGKRIDKFAKYIENAAEHNFFDTQDKLFYKKLTLLRKMRNRMHIQNEFRHLERDEEEVFTGRRRILTEQVLEKVVKVMSTKYPRVEHARGHVSDMEFPWREHF